MGTEKGKGVIEEESISWAPEKKTIGARPLTFGMQHLSSIPCAAACHCVSMLSALLMFTYSNGQRQ